MTFELHVHYNEVPRYIKNNIIKLIVAFDIIPIKLVINNN
jgi:hypothetical protein